MSSFTMMIKNEICQKSFLDCCQISLLSAFIHSNWFSCVHSTEQENSFRVCSFHEPTVKLIARLWNTQFPDSKLTVTSVKHTKVQNYLLEFSDLDSKITDDLGLQKDRFSFANKIEKKHCARAYIAGIFLVSGSINSPKTSNYHLELQFDELEFAKAIQKLLAKRFNLHFKIIKRRNKFVLYLKKSNDISDFLKLLDCPEAVFSFEDQRITRELLNTINRFNNIDISNQQKILDAGLKQVKMIQTIINLNCFNELSLKCQILAKLRLANQDASFAELGELYYQETGELITKSGVNHLMRQIKKKYQEFVIRVNFDSF